MRACAAAFAASLLLALIGGLARVEALALIGGYGVVFLGAGAAPFQLRPHLELYARLTGLVLVGFAVLLCVGGVMADIRGLWDPVAAAVILGVPTFLLHALGLRRAYVRRVERGGGAESLLTGFGGPEDEDFGAHRANDEAAADTGELTAVHARYARSRHRATARRTVSAAWSPGRLSLPWILLGTVFWLAPALWTRDSNPGYWGMLTTISPLWYLGLVLVLIGFAVGRSSGRAAALAAFSFGLATTLTPALVYGAARDQTAAKQLHLAQYVLAHHHLDVTAGIYQAFSTTFSGVAAFAQLLGVGGTLGHMSLWSVATYWPVLMVLMRVAVLRFLMGRLIASTARRWCAVMLVLLVDSLGADYFSPQAIGYVMAVGIVGLAINGLTPRPFGRRTTFLLLLFAGVALGPTHELSPYMAAGALVVLAIFGQAPWWTCLPVGVPALAWAGVVHTVISRHFNFSSLFNITNFQPPLTVATPGLHRLAVVGAQSHLLLLALLVLIALGAIGFLANVRERWAWAYALCPFVGIAFIAINPYGNEGIFRATLFAIPWMAVLAMRMPHPAVLASRLPPVARAFRDRRVITGGVALCLIGLLGTFLIAAYAMDGTNVLRRNDVAVVDYLMRQPRQDAFVVSVGSASNPADGADFTMPYHTLEWSQVATHTPALQQLRPQAADAVTLANRIRAVAATQGGTASSPLYVIWAHSSLLYDDAYGLQSRAQMRAWLQILKTSSSWQLVDRRGGAFVFKLT